MPEPRDVPDPLDHALVLAFDSESAEFARGFEAGRLWALLRTSDEPVSATVHASNSEMMLRVGEALGRPVSGEVLDESWTEISFGAPEEAAGLSPQPGG